MAVFLERFVLPLCVLVFGLVVLNQLNLNAHQRWSAVVALFAIAYLTAATVTRLTKKDTPVPTSAMSEVPVASPARAAAQPASAPASAPAGSALDSTSLAAPPPRRGSSNPRQGGIILEWAHPPHASYIRLTNNMPSVLLEVNVSIIDIKSKVDGIFVHTPLWTPARGPIPVGRPVAPPMVFHSESMLFQILRDALAEPIWYVGTSDMRIAEDQWEFTIKCVWRDQAKPLVKKFRFRFRDTIPYALP